MFRPHLPALGQPNSQPGPNMQAFYESLPDGPSVASPDPSRNAATWLAFRGAYIADAPSTVASEVADSIREEHDELTALLLNEEAVVSAVFAQLEPKRAERHNSNQIINPLAAERVAFANVGMNAFDARLGRSSGDPPPAQAIEYDKAVETETGDALATVVMARTSQGVRYCVNTRLPKGMLRHHFVESRAGVEVSASYREAGIPVANIDIAAVASQHRTDSGIILIERAKPVITPNR